jgi:hypothetical protein
MTLERAPRSVLGPACVLSLLVTLLVVLFAPFAAAAPLVPKALAEKHEKTAAADEARPPEPEAELGSPLASMRTFLELCRAGDYEAAAGFLELSKGRLADGP